MALYLQSNGSNWGVVVGGSADVEVGADAQAFYGHNFAFGSGSRRRFPNDGAGTSQYVYGTPRVTAYRTRDNKIVVTKIEITDLHFQYWDNGIPAGASLWGFTGTYYARSASGGWHWDNIFQWTSGYYTKSLASYRQNLNPSTRTVWSGSQTISWGDSWEVDLAQCVANTGEVSQHRNSTLLMRNTYSKPDPTPPIFNPSCKANQANGNTIMVDARGDYGYCEHQNNSATTSLYDNQEMTGTPLWSIPSPSGSATGLSPNTRYWIKFYKANGCKEGTATCSAVTVTPNSLSNIQMIHYDTISVRLAVTNGGGEYKPNTTIWVKPCNGGSWTQKGASKTTTIDIITIDGLEEKMCYMIQARTATGAGTYTGNTLTFTTPPKGICIANITSIETTLNDHTFDVCANICYDWETNMTPASLRVYYRVKDGYDDRWYYVDEPEVTEETGSRCVEICNLYPNQVVYEAYIHTETEEATYDSEMKEFITPVVPEPDIKNCENFDYLTALLCQAVVALYNGQKEIYANDCSKELCDPYSNNPTLLTLWTRALRLFHAIRCLLCDMGNARFAASKEGQYLVGEAGWQDILTEIDEQGEENWKIATSDAIKRYIMAKLEDVWHYHGAVDLLVYDSADLEKFPDATSAILTSENKVYRKVDGQWTVSAAVDDKIDDMGVWHINQESSTQAGYVQAGSAWYYWNDNWQPMDADMTAFAKLVDEMWSKKDQAVYNEAGASRLHLKVVNSEDFDCNSFIAGERWLVLITEPIIQSEPTYYTITFDVGANGKAMNPQSVVAGGKAQNPGAAESDSCTFLQWSLPTSPEVAFDWSTPINQDYTLEAQWDCGDYLVTEDEKNITTENEDKIVV